MDCELVAQQQQQQQKLILIQQQEQLQKQLLQQQQKHLHYQQQQQQQREEQQQQHSCHKRNIKNQASIAEVNGGGGSGSDSSVSPLKVTGQGETSGISGFGVFVGSGAAAAAPALAAVKLRQHSERCLKTPEAKSQTYRISMANLEDTQESELDLILGELSLLEAQINCGDATFLPGAGGGGAVGGGGVSGNSGMAVQATNMPMPIRTPPTNPNPINTNGFHTGGAITTVGGSSASSSTASSRTHSRTNSTVSGATTISSSDVNSICSSSGISENGCMPSRSSLAGGSVMLASGVIGSGSGNGGGVVMNINVREQRTESPDNDSAFSDTVSLLSSESSASSSTSSALHHQQRQLQQQQQQHLHQQQQQHITQHANACGGGGGGGGVSTMSSTSTSSVANNNSKAAKIQLALHKLESASIRRLFVKAFTSDGASKSLLVDERMTCGHVTRLLADKNHVQMQPNWALVENLGDLQMERLFEDHELLVDNLMTWNSDAGNRVLFQQRNDKVALFSKPEIFLPGPQMAPGCHHDEHTRSMLLEEFFETNSQLQVDGPLYMKADLKKGWKRYHFVLRSSGLYYFPKEKTKNTRDLACLVLFNGYNIYYGQGWKKKYKSPTDYTFGFKSGVDSSLGKSCRTLKLLCAENLETMEKWVTAIRISKYGKQLWDNHKAIMEDLCLGYGMSNDSFVVSMRSESISSISSAVPSQCGSISSAISSLSNSSGRISRASSSSSSGCLSDDNNAFDSEFTTGTIKRKPSMKPNLPLTTMTRQLKEVGEITICETASDNASATSPDRGGTLTRRHSRRKSQESNGNGTLKRRPAVHSMAVTSCAKQELKENLNVSIKTTSSEAPTTTLGVGIGVGSGSGLLSSPNSTPTPTMTTTTTTTTGIPVRTKPPLHDLPVNIAVAGHDLMCSSTLSLDSLPPPPPLIADEHDVFGSQLSLASLPPPPPPDEVLLTSYGVTAMATPMPMPMTIPMTMTIPMAMVMPNSNGALPPAIPTKPTKSAVKTTNQISNVVVSSAKPIAPPYKAPPDYVGPANAAAAATSIMTTQSPITNNAKILITNPIAATQPQSQSQPPPPPPPTTKKVSFADSPVLLRRNMCSPQPTAMRMPVTSLPYANNNSNSINNQQQHVHHNHGNFNHQQQQQQHNSQQPFYAPGPMLPPRTDLSSVANTSSVVDFNVHQTSPKRLQESASNPPRDFLKDLQRVMRKKWQVAQKCKLEPSTTPHEVLGFRDFNNDDLLAAHNLNTGAGANSLHYYRETANVSNWVQEHYGSGAAPPPPPHHDYALYENVHATNNKNAGTVSVAVVGATSVVSTNPIQAGTVGGQQVLVKSQFINNTGIEQQTDNINSGSSSVAFHQQAHAHLQAPPPPPPLASAAIALRKKRPPPPPPKRSDTTHLTHRV